MDSINTSLNNKNQILINTQNTSYNNPKLNVLNIIKQNKAINGSLKTNHIKIVKNNNKDMEENVILYKESTDNTSKLIKTNKLTNKTEKYDFSKKYFNEDSKETKKNKDSNKQEKEPKKDSEIIIVIIRHGERADLAGGEIKFDLYDPELTTKGIKQAYEAGCRLKEILDILKPNNKKIAILTSPFSRCIMTAKYVKNGMNYNLPLFIENGLSEFVNRQWFKDSPINFLCYVKYNNLLFQEISNEIIIDKSIVCLPDFPESTNKCTERFTDAFDKIIEQYANQTGFNVIILVTHFFGIQSLCEKMNIPLDNFDIEYCSTFVFKYNKDNKEFKFENNFYPIDEEIY